MACTADFTLGIIGFRNTPNRFVSLVSSYLYHLKFSSFGLKNSIIVLAGSPEQLQMSIHLNLQMTFFLFICD
jgi:hypothetical protein